MNQPASFDAFDPQGRDQLANASSLEQQVAALWEKGDLAQAQPTYERAPAIFGKRVSPDRADVESIARSLAALKQELRNQATDEP